MNKTDFRNSSQFLMPARKQAENVGRYSLYPTHSVGEGKIYNGFESLAEEIKNKRTVIIDG